MKVNPRPMKLGNQVVLIALLAIAPADAGAIPSAPDRAAG